jgi:hypothetical protein
MILPLPHACILFRGQLRRPAFVRRPSISVNYDGDLNWQRASAFIAIFALCCVRALARAKFNCIVCMSYEVVIGSPAPWVQRIIDIQ